MALTPKSEDNSDGGGPGLELRNSSAENAKQGSAQTQASLRLHAVLGWPLKPPEKDDALNMILLDPVEGEKKHPNNYDTQYKGKYQN